jgi:prepilin-type N-terminal cleavage/methylation domain-containing protein
MTGVKKSGFSLFEMLIVVALFSTAAVILSQLFVSFNQLHRKIANAAVLSQDMRFAMELLVRAARNNRIDYSAAPIPDRANSLTLETPTGGSIIVALRSGADCQDTSVTNCLALSVDGGTVWQPITARRVNVTNFDVYVRPSVSPFEGVSGGGYASDLQPYVTFSIGLDYRAQQAKDRASLRAQTTVTSRQYAR